MDVGSLITKLAVGRAGDTVRFRQRATDADELAGFLSRMLADARDQAGGTIGQICFAVPDAWLEGSEAGARRLEEMRRLAEEKLGWTSVAWVGQLPAVAALAAATSRDKLPAQGRFLVCDLGHQGVRVALCEVTDRVVRPVATRSAVAGGWRDFDAAVQAQLRADGHKQPRQWSEAARGQAPRARLVLVEEAGNPDFAETAVYRIDAGGRRHHLTARQLTDCFAATEQRLRAGIAAVLGNTGPDVAAVTGGLGWFPLAAWVIADQAGVDPEIIGPEAAAHGALLLSGGDLRLAWPDLPIVRLPVHQVVAGLLEDARLTLPWTASFADLGGDPLILDQPELILEVGGELRTARFPGLVPGPYRIGLRRASAGRGVLLLRADDAAVDQATHICSLDELELA
jgi:hypothetical protein